MKRTVFLGIALLLGAASLYAQKPLTQKGRVSLYVMAGPALSLHENAFSYRDEGRSMELLDLQYAAAVGYDFSEAVGLRFQGAFGKDAAACNVRQTAGNGFYPYTFKHVNGFADVVLNLSGLSGKATVFRPKIYAGLGGAYTFGFTDPGHPWQKITTKNTVFGFRGGFIAEYNFPFGLGMFMDLCGEAYTDMYNGLMPSDEDQQNYEGYAGLPFDLRGIASFGLVFRF